MSAQNVVSYTVVVGFANPGSLMLPGMTANVRIVTDTRDNVLKLPNAALRVRIAGVEPEARASGAASGGAGARCARAARAADALARGARRTRRPRSGRRGAAGGPGPARCATCASG